MPKTYMSGVTITSEGKKKNKPPPLRSTYFLYRNLKAFNFNTGSWCDNQDENKCICNDDDENTILYPWIHDHYTPITLDNAWGLNARIYYNSIASTTLDATQLTHRISEFTKNVSADIVILGLGNDDIQALRISPNHFYTQLTNTLSQLRQRIYPTQPIIVRTPQYFCCGVIPTTSWNAGRSATFAQIVRDAVKQHANMYLWDVHRLGTNENTCSSTYTKRNVVNMENLILWNLLCQ